MSLLFIFINIDTCIYYFIIDNNIIAFLLYFYYIILFYFLYFHFWSLILVFLCFTFLICIFLILFFNYIFVVFASVCYLLSSPISSLYLPRGSGIPLQSGAFHADWQACVSITTERNCVSEALSKAGTRFPAKRFIFKIKALIYWGWSSAAFNTDLK